jgi:Glycosyltransferase family 92
MPWKLASLGKISRLGLTPPVPAPGRSGVVLTVILRNEERYIAEWAAYHHAAGVRHFYVYDNGCTDATLPRLREALPEDALTVIPWRQSLSDTRLRRTLHNQVLAYAHAASNFGAHCRWMGFIDVDEFLVPKQAGNIPAALAHLEDAACVSLPWHMFGHSGHDTAPDGPVLRHYTQRGRDPMNPARGLCNFKCLADPCRLTAIRVHSMECDGRDVSVNDAGIESPNSKRKRPAFYSAAHLQLNHYYSRSREELDRKLQRGPASPTAMSDYERKVRRLVAAIEADTVEDLSALHFSRRTGFLP